MIDSSKYEEELAQEIISELEKLKGSRCNFESHWTEIAERMLPAHKNLFQNSGTSLTQGEKRNDFILDSTAPSALTKFSAILDSLLTPRTQMWHKLAPSNPNLLRDRAVKLWFENANKQLFRYRYAPKANFPSQNQAQYLSLGSYGTGALFTDKLRGRDTGLRYRNIHLSEIYFSENHQGIIDKAYRYFPHTIRQAIQRWGDKVPAKLREDKNQEKEVWFIHCVKPRTDYDEEKLNSQNYPWASYYVCKTEKALLEEGGYTSFPYAISRWVQIPGEVYGRSVAMDVLPAVKTLNEEKRTILKQGQRTVDPVLLVPDDGVVDGFTLKPGSMNAGGVTADGRPLVHTLPTGRLDIGKDLMDDEKIIINDGFLVSLFQIFTEGPQKSATEVLELAKEKGFLLAPTIGRQQSEYLDPLIEREMDLLMSQHLLDPMPQLLLEARGEYHIEYESPLSRTQRAEEAAGLSRTLEMATSVYNVTQDPRVMDVFDWDTAMPELADINGMPLRWTKSAQKIEEERAQRQEQAEQAQAVAAAPGAAALTKAAVVAQGQG